MADLAELAAVLRECIAESQTLVSGLRGSGESVRELSEAFAALGNLSIPPMLGEAGRSIGEAVQQSGSDAQTLREALDAAQAAR